MKRRSGKVGRDWHGFSAGDLLEKSRVGFYGERARKITKKESRKKKTPRTNEETMILR